MANKSEELRRVVTGLLKMSCERTYYEDADDDTSYPYQVFSFDSKSMTGERDDNMIIVDVWDKNKSWTNVEGIADTIESNMNMANEPNTYILPTIFLVRRRNLKDEDKTLKHVQIEFLIQNYTK